MKRFFRIMAICLFVVAFSGQAMAVNGFKAQGSATIPGIMYYYTDSNTWSLPYIMLTNTSSTSVNCQVNVYGSEGEDLGAAALVAKGGTNWITILNGPGIFEIPPHSTRCYILHFPASPYYTYAHAIVEWNSNDQFQKNALIGSCELRNKNQGIVTTSYLPVNNGNPF
ncbi:hypothetical protein [Maridesulfovibrio sp. FT414]|uniref:hypothetical protein n=1 Tax=Maridesulfovibrio sp. FT414 TaxID=2979469 RepID=UPI003D807A00